MMSTMMTAGHRLLFLVAACALCTLAMNVRPASAQDWRVTEPAVANSPALDQAIDHSERGDELRALRAGFASRWHAFLEEEAQTGVEVIRDVRVTRFARGIDEAFLSEVATQQLDAEGLIMYAMNIAWCDKLAVVIRTIFPGNRGPEAEELGWRIVSEAAPDELQHIVSGANALAAEELATAMQVLDVLSPRTREVPVVVGTWWSQRLKRTAWLAQELAGDDTHQALIDASGNLSLLLPVTHWVREAIDDLELEALCSSLEGALADHWQRYSAAMATAAARRNDESASRAVFRLWHPLVKRERDAINLILAACRNAEHELPPAVRLIETAVNHRNPYADQ